jgi:Domain of unknown function (DUF397)
MTPKKKKKRMRQSFEGKIEPSFAESSYSSPGDRAVLEIGFAASEVLLRDSAKPNSPVLHFTPEEWRAFISGVRAGLFDLD